MSTEMNRPDCIIGIDPDREKSGVAFLNVSTRMMEAAPIPFPELLEYLQEKRDRLKALGKSLLVVVEAGWLVTKSNYHPFQGHRAEKISKDVGANHETGRKIIEMCGHYGIDVLAHYPLKKCWKGRDGKITAEELEAVTGYSGRTNQDVRDAALLAWYSAGLPIVIKC